MFADVVGEQEGLLPRLTPKLLYKVKWAETIEAVVFIFVKVSNYFIQERGAIIGFLQDGFLKVDLLVIYLAKGLDLLHLVLIPFLRLRNLFYQAFYLLEGFVQFLLDKYIASIIYVV